MLGLFTGLKGIAIAAAVSLAVGSFSGWKVRDAFCDAAAEKVRAEAAEAKLRNANLTIKLQQDRIETLNVLRAADAVRAQLDLDAERQNQENINATPQNTSACLDAAASRRVRETR
jgi:hypothetical protein